MRRLGSMAVFLCALGAASSAAAEVGGARPRGFALEVELAGSAPILVTELGLLGASSWSLGPKLFLGAQLGRFAVGGQLGMSVASSNRGGRDNTAWSMAIGPQVDYEVWQSGSGAITIGGSLPVQVVADEDFITPGFGVDFALGGRLWVGRWLAVAVEAGTRLEALFFDPDDRDDYTVVLWQVYGGFSMRFVAG